MVVYEGMMRELENEELPQPKSIRRQRRWSEDTGDEVSVDRLMKGQAFWNQTYREHRPGPLSVTIITDITTSCSVKHTEILWRGAAAVMLTQLLEKAGYRVELWAANYCDSAYNNGRKNLIAVQYKRGGDPLDVSTLINGVSGWCYRTMFFGSYCISDHAPTRSLGYPANINDIKQHITPDEQALVCQGVWSRYQAISWVRSQLASMFHTV